MSAPVRIERIAAGGEGVGRLPDGRAVFVARTAPGDLVDLGPVTLRARYARASLARVVEPGPGRTAPRCRHYDRDACGGCQLQHLDLPAQQAARRAIVGDALRRLGRLDLPDPPLEPAPAPWGYRTRITLGWDRRSRGPGYHRVNEPDRVFPLERCEIAADALNELWQAVRSAGVVWPRGATRVQLRLARDGSRHLLLTSREAPPAESVTAIRGLGAALWWRRADRAHAARPVFEQVHPAMGERIRAWAVDQAGPVAGRVVWDLYAGIGETTALLAARGARVDSVERDREAVALANRGGTPPDLRRHAGRAEDRVTALRPPAVVILNPPRAGLAARVVEAIRARRPERVVYVSCNPATLARDLTRLAGDFRVAEVRAFDLFPQTAHVETVVRLERR
jgi:23S rRNA (uracil1939-C5)-methyltransferase